MVDLQRWILLCLALAIGGSSLSLASEKWPYFVTALVEGGHDSNVSGLNSDLAGVHSTETFDFWLEGDIARRWGRDRIAEVAFGASGWKREHGEEPFELETYAWHVRSEFDLGKGVAKSLQFERLTFGAQFEDRRLRLAGRSFAESEKMTAGFQGTWKASSECNFDNVLLYYEREDFDDGPVANPAFSRSGIHESVGVEVNLYLYGDYSEENCRRPSIFRRYWQSGITSLTFGYRNDDIQTASEFASRADRLYFDGRFPLRVVQGEPRWSLDASVGVAQVEYDNPSVFAPFAARKDTPRYSETALVRHLQSLDLRFGYRWETNAASDIDRYAYERDFFFFALVFERHDESDIGGGSTGSGGSTSGRRGGDAGASDPVDPEPGGGGK